MTTEEIFEHIHQLQHAIMDAFPPGRGSLNALDRLEEVTLWVEIAVAEDENDGSP